LISPRLIGRYQFKVHAKIIRDERISGEDEGEDSGRLPIQYIALEDNCVIGPTGRQKSAIVWAYRLTKERSGV
jgi:hypothetical protein